MRRLSTRVLTPVLQHRMQVLILGATGFLGLPAAQALLRAGHLVYGLARTPEKAQILAREEIIPILGDIDSDTYMHLIPTLDVVISALSSSPGALLATFEKIAQAAESSRPDGPRLTYIHTSGTWIHGDDRNTIVTDTTPITRPVALMQGWLPALEQRVVRSLAVNGIVLRPSLVYGRTASNFNALFRKAAAGKIEWPGTPGGRYAVIHVDDVADAYVHAAEKALIAGGKIFDISNPSTESVDELLKHLLQVSGAKEPYEYTKPANLLEEALASTALVRPYLAHALLGWSAKKPGLTEGLDIYYAAWRAAAGL